MNEKILVVDDEKEIADLIEVYLQNENMDVYKFYSGEEALSCIKSTDFDLAILDIMLPDISGLSICQMIRSKEYSGDAAGTYTDYPSYRIRMGGD